MLEGTMRVKLVSGSYTRTEGKNSVRYFPGQEFNITANEYKMLGTMVALVPVPTKAKSITQDAPTIPETKQPRNPMGYEALGGGHYLFENGEKVRGIANVERRLKELEHGSGN
jgi:hypothetical protein